MSVSYYYSLADEIPPITNLLMSESGDSLLDEGGNQITPEG